MVYGADWCGEWKTAKPYETELEHKSHNQAVMHTNDAGDTAKHLMHKEAKPDMAAAIRRAAELSVDHFTAWIGEGTGWSMAKSLTEEIVQNMTAALKEAK